MNQFWPERALRICRSFSLWMTLVQYFNHWLHCTTDENKWRWQCKFLSFYVFFHKAFSPFCRGQGQPDCHYFLCQPSQAPPRKKSLLRPLAKATCAIANLIKNECLCRHPGNEHLLLSLLTFAFDSFLNFFFAFQRFFREFNRDTKSQLKVGSRMLS